MGLFRHPRQWYLERLKDPPTSFRVTTILQNTNPHPITASEWLNFVIELFVAFDTSRTFIVSWLMSRHRLNYGKTTYIFIYQTKALLLSWNSSHMLSCVLIEYQDIFFQTWKTTRGHIHDMALAHGQESFCRYFDSYKTTLWHGHD